MCVDPKLIVIRMHCIAVASTPMHGATAAHVCRRVCFHMIQTWIWRHAASHHEIQSACAYVNALLQSDILQLLGRRYSSVPLRLTACQALMLLAEYEPRGSYFCNTFVWGVDLLRCQMDHLQERRRRPQQHAKHDWKPHDKCPKLE